MFSKSPKKSINRQDCQKLISDLKAIGQKNIDTYLKKAFSNCRDCKTSVE